MEEEYWTKRDGTKIAVGDMDVEHLRNTLRMILRQRRRAVVETIEYDDFGDGQDVSSAQAYRDLANPRVFFPLLDGGIYGSAALQVKYGGKR